MIVCPSVTRKALSVLMLQSSNLTIKFLILMGKSYFEILSRTWDSWCLRCIMQRWPKREKPNRIIHICYKGVDRTSTLDESIPAQDYFYYLHPYSHHHFIITKKLKSSWRELSDLPNKDNQQIKMLVDAGPCEKGYIMETWGLIKGSRLWVITIWNNSM